MQKNGLLLTILCIISMTLLLELQAYWIYNYYGLTRNNFEKEVNLAFEDAIKKEFSNRADSMEVLLRNHLMDTTKFRVSGVRSSTDIGSVIYTVAPVSNPNDSYSSSFSFRDYHMLPNKFNEQEVRRTIVNRFVKMLRSEDLENHIVYYRTQDLGRFMVEITEAQQFDTTSLRPVLTKYLKERNIEVPFRFSVKKDDSTTNRSNFDPQVIKQYPVITRALPTYKDGNSESYVRAMFNDPFLYIISNMWLILLSSVILILTIAFSMRFLLSSLNREKKLSAIKNDFISNITHEFKTPIATASLAIEALNDPRTLENSEKTSRYLTHAKNELARINTLTTKILKLSLYENADSVLNKEMILLNKSIQELIEIHQLTEKQVEIVYTNNSEIESFSADRIEFQHAVSNVMENAYI